MTKTKLAKAIAFVIAGSALSVGTASAHVMYNTFSTTGVPNVSTGVLNPNGLNNNTDGWNYVYDGTDVDTVATGPESKGHLGTQVSWVGTTGSALPFGYTGSAHLNWAAEIHAAGASLEVSSDDSFADYGVRAEIDTGAGAWLDNGLDANGVPTATGPTGWKHQLDLGLIKSHVTTTVRLNLEAINGVNDNFGVTIFTGMDTTTGDYSHHGGWNNPLNPVTNNNPFYVNTTTGVSSGSGMAYLTHDGTVDTTNFIEFEALAGQVYTIALGGNGVGRWNANAAEYKMTISAVPVPGAVWLFGSALAGLVGFKRRRNA